MNANEFRAELQKIMPGYAWTVHKSRAEGYLDATGIQSSGFNRLSTLHVERREQGAPVEYTAKSAGYGRRARWMHECSGGTLARALRGLQDYYERVAATHRTHASYLANGRRAEPKEGGSK